MIFYEENLNNYQIVPGTTLKEEQLEAIDFILHNFSCVINLSTGLGKCKKAGSRVLTRDGYKNIEELLPNADYGVTPLKIQVWTGEEWAYTKNFYKEKSCRIRNLRLANGSVVNGTLEHPVNVYGSTIGLKKIGDIQPGEFIAMSRYVPEFGTRKMDVFDAYTLGLWIGDGSHGHDKRNGGVSYSVEGELEVIREVSDIFDVPMYETRNNTWRVQFRRKSKFSKFLLEQEGCRNSSNKIIPQIIFDATSVEREALFWGLVDSDGSIAGGEKEGVVDPNKVNLEITTKSKELADNLEHLNQVLGLRAKRCIKVLRTGKYKGNVYYRFLYNRESLYRKQWQFIPEWSRKFRNLRRITWNSINSTDAIFISKERAQDLLDKLTEDKSKLTKSSDKRVYDICRSYLREVISGKKSGITSIHSKHFSPIEPYVQDLMNYLPVQVVAFEEEVCDVYDIEMDTDEHVFYCDGMINHNTLVSLVASYWIMKKTNDTVTFIICPKQANTAYKKELNKLGFKYSISVTGEKQYKNGSRYFIFNYSNPDDMIALLTKLKEQSYRVIGIFDEVHVLGNPDSGVSKKMNSVRRMFACCIGISACVVEGTKISTSRGLVNAEDVRIGDKVLIRGQEKSVLNSFYNGRVRCYRLETHRGFVLECTYNHPILVGDKFVNAEDVKVGDTVKIDGRFEYELDPEVITPRLYQATSVMARANTKNSMSRVIVNEDFATMYGWLLSDGYVESNGSTVGFCFSSHEQEFDQEIIKWLDSVGLVWYCVDRIIEDKSRNNQDTVRYLRVRDRQFNQFIQDLGYDKRGHNFCRIPEVIFRASTSVKKRFIRALFSGDGSFSYSIRKGRLRRCVSYTTASEMMARDLLLLLNELGFDGKFYKHYREQDSRGVKGGWIYKVNIYNQQIVKFIQEMEIPEFKLSNVDLGIEERKKFKEKDYSDDYIERIEFLGERETYGHTVEDGVYVTNGIVTHNTPLLNDMKGLWAVCNFVKPGKMGNWWQFKDNWLITRKRTIRVRGGKSRQIEELVGYKDLDGLRVKLEEFIISRTYEYPLRYHYRDCTLTKQEMDIYELAAKGVLDDEYQEDYAPRLWNLQRVADGCDDRSRELGVSSKQKLLITVLKEILDRDEGALVYTELEDTYTVLGDLIEQYKGYLGYHKLWYITGKTDFVKRVKCEKTLQAKDIVICTKAGNKSLNLQAVNNVVFYDYSFACGDIIQMIGRVARVDSKYEYQNITFLEAKDTIDTYKRMLMQSNMTIIQEVFGKSKNLVYYGDIDNDVMKKYRQYFKNHMLWKR